MCFSLSPTRATSVLRDKIAEHAIQFGGAALGLGEHDAREDV